MGNMKILFRWIAACQLILLTVWYFTPWGFAYEGFELLPLFNGANSWLRTEVLIRVSVISTIGYVLIYLGLFFFQAWARVLLLIISLFNLLLSPFTGFAVESAYESAFGYLLTLGDGFLLCAMYFTDIRKSFNNKSP